MDEYIPHARSNSSSMTAYRVEVADIATAKAAATRPTEHQITRIEALAYTLLIAFVAMLALGWFDLMIPWQS